MFEDRLLIHGWLLGQEEEAKGTREKDSLSQTHHIRAEVLLSQILGAEEGEEEGQTEMVQWIIHRALAKMQQTITTVM